MSRKQKGLGNKGFSLVELIVVIAIMAVLIGVLAPTLIKNVEKSRESTDIQNLDSIRSAVTTALSDEAVYDEVGSGTVTIPLGTGSTASLDKIDDTKYKELKEQLQETLKSSVKMKAKASSAGNVIITISNGKVTVGVYSTSGVSGGAISCNRLSDSTFLSE